MQRVSAFEFKHLRVVRIVTGPIEENCYLLIAADGQSLVIDPGEEAEMIHAQLQRLGAKPTAVLLTHAHFDHIGAVQGLRRIYEQPGLGDLPVYLHPDAQSQYEQAHLAASRWKIPFEQPSPANRDLKLGVFKLAGIELDVRSTPGHAPGHVSFCAKGDGLEPGFVLSGDALFKGSIGRTDLPGCDHELLLERIKSQLMDLPDQTLVFSGHGAETTIGVERISNPYLS